jgi:hypothetical protein
MSAIDVTNQLGGQLGPSGQAWNIHHRHLMCYLCRPLGVQVNPRTDLDYVAALTRMVQLMYRHMQKKHPEVVQMLALAGEGLPVKDYRIGTFSAPMYYAYPHDGTYILEMRPRNS